MGLGDEPMVMMMMIMMERQPRAVAGVVEAMQYFCTGPRFTATQPDGGQSRRADDARVRRATYLDTDHARQSNPNGATRGPGHAAYRARCPALVARGRAGWTPGRERAEQHDPTALGEARPIWWRRPWAETWSIAGACLGRATRPARVAAGTVVDTRGPEHGLTAAPPARPGRVLPGRPTAGGVLCACARWRSSPDTLSRYARGCERAATLRLRPSPTWLGICSAARA